VDFELNSDQIALADGIRRLCDGRFPLERLRIAEGSASAIDDRAWQELADAGVFSLRAVGDEGLGLGMAEAAVVFEELGRALVPGPLVASHVAATLGLVDGAATGKAVVGAARRPSTVKLDAVVPVLLDHFGALTELVVVDDGSTDETAKEAEAAGAAVLSLPGTTGKGKAMQEGLRATSGEVIVFCDADIYDFSARFVLGVLGPLLTAPGTALVKGAYRRPLDGQEGEGGRVTELVAKPVLRLLFPELPSLRQPLAGEIASWRHVLNVLEFESGYGVEIGMLIDIARLYGAASIVESDLGERRHRNRPLSELAPQAQTVIEVALRRAALL